MNLFLAFLTTLPWWRWPLAVIALLFCARVWFRPKVGIRASVTKFWQRAATPDKRIEDERNDR